MTKQTDALLPCPFCRSEDIDPTGMAFYPEGDRSKGIHYAPACCDCGASAGTDAATWNTRAYQQAQADAPAQALAHEALVEDGNAVALWLLKQKFEHHNNMALIVKRLCNALTPGALVAAPREPSGWNAALNDAALDDATLAYMESKGWTTDAAQAERGANSKEWLAERLDTKLIVQTYRAVERDEAVPDECLADNGGGAHG